MRSVNRDWASRQAAIFGAGGMKKVDMTELTLVHCGQSWPHAYLPCSRQMIRHLERNEDIVTWVQVVAVRALAVIKPFKPICSCCC